MSLYFVKGCNESTCGEWGECDASCGVLGTQTRDCTDNVCGTDEEQRTCTGPCMYFLSFYDDKF